MKMDLFVVNRHNGDDVKPTEEDEKQQFAKLLNRIEMNKSHRLKAKEKKIIKRINANKSLNERAEKRLKKATNEMLNNPHEEFIDDNLKEPEAASHEEIKANTVQPSDYTVLGNDDFQTKAKVKRVLPKWLANPSVISVNLQELHMKVKDMKELDRGLRKILKENGIKFFFPVQAEVIPWLLEARRKSDVVFPRDVCISAPTGSGKTLTFVLPVIQALMNNMIHVIRALVILPTQDLASQVHKAFKTYSQHTNLKVALITGKTSFVNEQMQLVTRNEAFGYMSKVDILVCTAGRLVDHMKETNGFSLQYLEYLIIDEADRVLETVQNDWLYHLEKHIHQDEPPTAKILNVISLKKPRPPQKLLFSATLSQDPEKLQKLSLFQPKLFTSVVQATSLKCDQDPVINESNKETFIGKYTTPNELTEKYIVTSLTLKPLVLYEFIKKLDLSRCMVFTHSIQSTHRLAVLLRTLFNGKKTVQDVSSSLAPKERNNLIANFEKGNIDLLICTDALARGIDLPQVQCVISYSSPKFIKTYIHRVGRTARAGEAGLAVTLLEYQQLPNFQDMLEQANKPKLEEITINEADLKHISEEYERALVQLKKTVQSEGKEKIKKVKTTKRILKPKGGNTKRIKKTNVVHNSDTK